MTSSGDFTRKATEEDEAEIRRLLREAPMRGAVQVSLEREPNANLATEIEGDKHDTVLILNAEQQMLGMGSRAVRDVYINGEKRRLGYLGQLRAEPGRRGYRRLVAGFKSIERTRTLDEGTYDVTSIIADNKNAIRLLTKGLAKLPQYDHFAQISTFIIPTSNSKTTKNKHIRKAKEDELSKISECLKSYCKKYQFSPVWDIQTISDPKLCRGLSFSDFIVLNDTDKITSCLAIWDQREFKQVVIKGYSGLIRTARPIINLFFRLTKKPLLPKAPATLNLAYLSHFAIEDDNPDIARMLIEEARLDANNRGLDYLVLGLAEGHPLHDFVKAYFPNYTYTSSLYTVHWDGGELDKELAQVVPYVEVAVL